MTKDTLTTKELAERWGYTIRHIQRLRAEGTGPAFTKIMKGRQGRIIYKMKDIIDWENKRKQV